MADNLLSHNQIPSPHDQDLSPHDQNPSPRNQNRRKRSAPIEPPPNPQLAQLRGGQDRADDEFYESACNGSNWSHSNVVRGFNITINEFIEVEEEMTKALLEDELYHTSLDQEPAMLVLSPVFETEVTGYRGLVNYIKEA